MRPTPPVGGWPDPVPATPDPPAPNPASRRHATRLLRTGRVPAAQAILRAIDIAADKGDDRPARNLLIATGVIRPDPPSPPVVVVVNAGSADPRLSRPQLPSEAKLAAAKIVDAQRVLPRGQSD
jgi:hypothetical protein